MGADPADQPRSGLEEGEFVAGKDDSVGSDDYARYVLQHRHGGGGGLPEIKRRRLEFEGIIVDGGALPSPTPSSDRDSDGTISDVDLDAGAGADPLARGLLFPCPVCPREFASQKAVCGHMRAHDPRGRRQGEKERPAAVTVAISSGWAVTGKRGSVGGRSVSPESEGVVDSMATVVPEPVLDPMPIAFASRSSSAEPNPPKEDGSMSIVVASSDSPTSQIVAHTPCSRQFPEGHQPTATQPTVAQGQQVAEAAAPQSVIHQRAAPQVVGHDVQRSSPPPPPARDAQGMWLCKEKGCDHRYATHQGLGGHMAGHKIRQNNEAAAAALHIGVGDPKPAKLFPCKLCPSVFTSGVQLGGHMRKHYPGKVTPKKRPGARPKVSARELASALSLSLPLPPAAMEVAQAQPAGAPGVVRIFGVNIVPPGLPASTAEEVSSAATETDPSSAASTDIEQ